MSPSVAMKIKISRPHTVPTGPGLVLILIVTAMLLTSMNYSNNMGYILCFLLGSLMLVAFLHTRNNLKGLDITNIQCHPVFAGEKLQFTFELQNRSKALRMAIYPSAYGSRSGEDFSGPFSVAPLSSTTANISVTTTRRGRLTLSRITLITVYPLGLFRVQRHVRVNRVYLVYPQPAGMRKWPEFEAHEDESSEGFYNRGGDDFVGVRPYRIGESQHHIDWKAVARGRPLSVKEFTGGGSEQLWFDWNQLGGMDIEARISQLTRWVLEADQEGREFGLRLPGIKINLDSSPGHTVKCLETLAVFRNQP